MSAIPIGMNFMPPQSRNCASTWAEQKPTKPPHPGTATNRAFFTAYPLGKSPGRGLEMPQGDAVPGINAWATYKAARGHAKPTGRPRLRLIPNLCSVLPSQASSTLRRKSSRSRRVASRSNIRYFISSRSWLRASCTSDRIRRRRRSALDDAQENRLDLIAIFGRQTAQQGAQIDEIGGEFFEIGFDDAAGMVHVGCFSGVVNLR